MKATTWSVAASFKVHILGKIFYFWNLDNFRNLDLFNQLYMKFLLKILPILLLFSGCVKMKIYRAEKLSRERLEARESVYVQELTARKNESANFSKTNGELNRTIGTLEEKNRDLQDEVDAKLRQFGESKGQLSDENARLRGQIQFLEDSLGGQNRILQKYWSAENAQAEALNQVYDALGERFAVAFSNGVTLEKTESEVLLTLPDPMIFQTDGITIGADGKTQLVRLADHLFNNPALTVEIQAFTDNTLPTKLKFADSWDWSLARAMAVCRVLVRELNVNANQLTPVGKGEFFPVASNDTKEGRAENRRTVVLIKPKIPQKQ